MAGRRPRKGDRRIDAAIDHFTQMGYAKADIRSIIKKLLAEVYGNDGWPFLEEDSYRVVQDALFEKQEQEEQRQLQLLQEEEEQGKEETRQLVAAMDEAPLENNMPILKVHNEVPAEAELAVEEVDSMPIDPPALEAILPLPAATGAVATRPPCYGWISESDTDNESDNKEHPASQQHEVHVPSPGGGLLCKRKRPSRWDV